MHFKEGKRQQGREVSMAPVGVMIEGPAMMVLEKLAGTRTYLMDAVYAGKAKPTYHEEFTSSCEEKAEVAGISKENVLKVVFFEYEMKLYCVALPDEGEIDKKELFTKLLGISRSAAGKKMNMAKSLPTGMSYGTCSPFFTKENILEVELVILANADPRKLVDVSIGGSNTESRKCSVQMRYGDVVDILKEEFGDKIIQCEIPVKR